MNIKVHCRVPIPSQMNALYTLPSFSFKIYFNIILLCMPRSSKCSLSLRFPYPVRVCISLTSPMRLTPAHLISCNLITQVMFNKQYKPWSPALCSFICVAGQWQAPADTCRVAAAGCKWDEELAVSPKDRQHPWSVLQANDSWRGDALWVLCRTELGVFLWINFDRLHTRL